MPDKLMRSSLSYQSRYKMIRNLPRLKSEIFKCGHVNAIKSVFTRLFTHSCLFSCDCTFVRSHVRKSILVASYVACEAPAEKKLSKIFSCVQET